MEQPESTTSTPEVGSNDAAEGSGSVASVPAGKENAASPANPEGANQPAVNYEAKYKELQRAYTQETQRRAAIEKERQALDGKWSGIEKHLAEQAKQLAEMRKVPYDREKFLAEFQDKGPEILKPLWQEDINAVKTEHSKLVEAQTAELRNLRTSIAVMERRNDPDNYPDFKKLEPAISEIMNSPNCPVDFSKPISEVLDILYSLARQTNSADALLEAEKAGAKTAEAKLVRESKTTVTGGGKAASITAPNTDKMSLDELRKHVISVNGVVDRD